MKKVISLALCVMMLTSFLAINTNAAMTVYGKVDYTTIYNKYSAEDDADNALDTEFPSTQFGTTNGASINVVNDGTGNEVIEMALNGIGAGDGTATSALMVIPSAHMVVGWSSSDLTNYAVELDVMPVKNTSGIGVSLNKGEKRISLYTSIFTENKWTTVKIVWNNSVLTIFAKDKDAADSAFVELVENTDYSCSKWILSSSQAHIGLDTKNFSVAGHRNDEALMEAVYYFDNIKIDKIKEYSYHTGNLYFSDPNMNHVFATSSGVSKSSYAVPTVWLPGSYFSMSFDAVRTDGNRPIDIAYCSNPYDSSSHAVNLFTGEQNVKYTYKVDFNGSAIEKVVRKAEGSNTWELLTAGVDYSAGSIHGAKSAYLKFNYLGDYFAGKDSELVKYCGPNHAVNNLDVDTKWTISNFQLTNNIAVSAIVEDVESGSIVSVSAEGGHNYAPPAEDKFTVMVAAYNGDVMVAAGATEINYAGNADIALNHADYSGLTYKLFVWDNDENGAPLLDAIDITSWVK